MQEWELKNELLSSNKSSTEKGAKSSHWHHVLLNSCNTDASIADCMAWYPEGLTSHSETCFCAMEFGYWSSVLGIWWEHVLGEQPPSRGPGRKYGDHLSGNRALLLECVWRRWAWQRWLLWYQSWRHWRMKSNAPSFIRGSTHCFQPISTGTWYSLILRLSTV